MSRPHNAALYKGRLTVKKLISWLNEEFIRLEINNYEVYAIDRSRFTSDQYQNGAYFLYVRFRSKSDPNQTEVFHCFYPIKDYQMYTRSGYELYLKFENRNLMINSLSIEVRQLQY